MAYVSKIQFLQFTLSYLIIFTAAQQSRKQVQLFDDYDFQGLIFQGLATSSCVDIPAMGRSETSSIITGVCLNIFIASDCYSGSQYPSITLSAGKYANLSDVAHLSMNFDKAIASFMECKGEPSHVTVHNINGYILVEYFDIRGCINLPSYALDQVNGVRNFGTCIIIFEETNCTGNFVKLLGGVSLESELLEHADFTGRTKSLDLCENSLNTP